MHLASDFSNIAASVQQFKAEYKAHAGDPGRLNGHVKDVKVGFSVHIHVAETDAQALEQARPAFSLFAHNFTYRYVRRGDTQRYANRENFEDQLAHGRILVGSPGTVRERLGAMLEQSGANYVLGCFAFGSLTQDQTLRSVELFANEVMPALREPQAVSA